MLAADPIAFGSAQHPLAELVGNDECGLLFLQAKILVLGIEYLGIAVAVDSLRSRKAGQDLPRSWVIGNLAFYVDGLDQASAGRLREFGQGSRHFCVQVQRFRQQGVFKRFDRMAGARAA